MHGPLTAAMVGFQISMPDSKVVMVGHSQNEPGQSPVEPSESFRSPCGRPGRIASLT